ARERLVTLASEIERRSDVRKSRDTDSVANDRNAILKVSEELRITTNRSKRTRQTRDVITAASGEHSDTRRRCRNTGNNLRCTRWIRSNNDVLRCDKCVDWRNRADRTHVVTANREFVTQEEPLENWHARDKCQRLSVSDF